MRYYRHIEAYLKAWIALVIIIIIIIVIIVNAIGTFTHGIFVSMKIDARDQWEREAKNNITEIQLLNGSWSAAKMERLYRSFISQLFYKISARYIQSFVWLIEVLAFSFLMRGKIFIRVFYATRVIEWRRRRLINHVKISREAVNYGGREKIWSKEFKCHAYECTTAYRDA